MALSGQSTAYLIFNSSATAASYSGTLTGVVAGELIVVVLACDGGSNAQDPSGYTVTLGSDALTYRAGQGTSLVVGFSAIYTCVASASGDQTLTVAITNATRAMKAHAFRITGFDTTTPVANVGQNDNHGGNVASLTSPNGVTTAADGNAIIGGISVHGGDVTNLAVGSADGSAVGQTGSDAFSDCEWGVAWQTTATAASVTFAWTWTTADRPGAAWVEIAAAAGGSSLLTSSGIASATFVGASERKATASASGVATASFTGAATHSAVMSAAGVAVASFATVGSVSVFSSSGVATAAFAGAATKLALMSSTAGATAAFSGTAIRSALMSSVAGATVSFVSIASSSVMVSSGVATAQFSGLSIAMTNLNIIAFSDAVLYGEGNTVAGRGSATPRSSGNSGSVINAGRAGFFQGRGRYGRIGSR